MKKSYGLGIASLALLGLVASSAVAGIDIDLRTSAGLTINGAVGFDNTGRSVAYGDLDNDGFRDIIIGSVGVDAAGNTLPNAGAIDVVWGNTRAALGTSRDLLTQSDLRIEGADASDQTGVFVAAGDFNGDGFDDVAIGASAADGQGNLAADAGEVYIFYGRARAAWAGINSVTQADVVLYGEDAGDNAGIFVAAGDINGDGFADLAVGASSADGPANVRNAAGAVYVLPGSAVSPGATVPLASLLTVDGADAGDLAGRALAIGDIDGDGLDDLVIGVPNSGGPGNIRGLGGEAAVLWGRSFVPWGVGSDLASGADLVVYGADGSDNAGTWVDVVDFDGDGYGDLVLGAPLADGATNTKSNAGEAFVIYGDARASLPSSIDLNAGIGTGKRFVGADAGDLFGSSVTGGDLDGDGREEVVMAAPQADGNANGRLSCGETFLYFGVPRASLPSQVDVGTLNDVRIIGADASDRSGSMVAMGDLDNDGGLDLGLGAPGGASVGNGRLGAGEVAILYGFGQVVPALLAEIDVVANDQGGVTVSWSTTQQDQIRGFNLYRVLGPGAYELVNESLIAATLGSEGVYSFVDAAAHAGVTGYEIRQVDARGAESYLGFVAYGAGPSVVTEFALRRLATPFTGSTSFALALPARLEGQRFAVALYDNAGRRVQTLAEGTVVAGSLDVRLDGAALRAGVYHVLATAGAERVAAKVVKL